MREQRTSKLIPPLHPRRDEHKLQPGLGARIVPRLADILGRRRRRHAHREPHAVPVPAQPGAGPQQPRHAPQEPGGTLRLPPAARGQVQRPLRRRGGGQGEDGDDGAERGAHLGRLGREEGVGPGRGVGREVQPDGHRRRVVLRREGEGVCGSCEGWFR